MIKGNKIGRRLFLGGAGALVAMPFFDSLLGKAAQADDTPPRRFIAFYVPNGFHMKAWTPQMQGTGFDLPTILAPLANVQGKLNVLTGLANDPAMPDVVGDHASGTGSFLTAVHVTKTEGPDIKNGISVDQMIANKIGPSTRIPSMQLGIDGGGSIGDCDSGYSCAYARNISWASEKEPLQKAINPLVVFNQIFDGLDPAASAAEKAKRLKYRTSVLDYVLADAKRLESQLGTSDRQKLDQYMTGVSEVEKQIQKAQGAVCPIVPKPPTSFSYPEHVKLMTDLMVLAMQCDVTRVISFMLGNAGSNQTYEFIGVPDAHHQISHHQGLQENNDKLTTIGTWEVAQLAYLLESMDAIQETGGTMLDNSVVFFSSEIEDGDAHRHQNLPVILAGGLAGAFPTGRHVVYADKPPLANLFLRLVNEFGVEASSFGDDSTAPLTV